MVGEIWDVKAVVEDLTARQHVGPSENGDA